MLQSVRLLGPLSLLENSILIGLQGSHLLAKPIELNVIDGLKCIELGQKNVGDVLYSLMSLLSACDLMEKFAFGDFTTKGTKRDVVKPVSSMMKRSMFGEGFLRMV